jgi:hypothetical protein
VADGATGELYSDTEPGTLAEALRSFEPARFDPTVIRGHAERFDTARFDEAIERIVAELVHG